MQTVCERELMRDEATNAVTRVSGDLPEDKTFCVELDARSLIYESELEEEFSQALADYGGDVARSSLLWKLGTMLLILCALGLGVRSLSVNLREMTLKEFNADENLRGTVIERPKQAGGQISAEQILASHEDNPNLPERRRVAFAVIRAISGGDPRALALAAGSAPRQNSAQSGR